MDRLNAMRRIAKVQAEMVKLAEWRIAAADHRLAALHQDRQQVADYVSGEGGLGVPLAKAALRSMLSIDGRKADLERARGLEAAKLDALRRRDRAIATRLEAALSEHRSATEKAELTAIVESWLARTGESDDARVTRDQNQDPTILS